jgi:hypothetical protein
MPSGKSVRRVSVASRATGRLTVSSPSAGRRKRCGALDPARNPTGLLRDDRRREATLAAHSVSYAVGKQNHSKECDCEH